jgi:DNA-directed RNA polymerase I subunit RPA2
VHTPDGSPCGLLNYLSHTCKIITNELNVSYIPSLIISLGVTQSISHAIDMPNAVSIQLDGRIIRWCLPAHALLIARMLCLWKVEGSWGADGP